MVWVAESIQVNSQHIVVLVFDQLQGADAIFVIASGLDIKDTVHFLLNLTSKRAVFDSITPG